jgi:hypothetical protein
MGFNTAVFNCPHGGQQMTNNYRPNHTVIPRLGTLPAKRSCSLA